MTVEAFLARVYVDAAARQRFLADPVGEARRAGLADADARALASIDRDGLALAVESFAAKRTHRTRETRDGRGPTADPSSRT